MLDNDERFQRLRRHLLEQPSTQQILIDKSVATVDHIIHQTDGQSELVTNKQKSNKFQNTIFRHCLHESRFRGLAREIHEIHDSFFKNTIYEAIRLIVGRRNNPNLDFELTSKHPSSSLLKNEPLRQREKVKFFLINFYLIFLTIPCLFLSFLFRTKTNE